MESDGVFKNPVGVPLRSTFDSPGAVQLYRFEAMPTIGMLKVRPTADPR